MDKMEFLGFWINLGNLIIPVDVFKHVLKKPGIYTFEMYSIHETF